MRDFRISLLFFGFIAIIMSCVDHNSSSEIRGKVVEDSLRQYTKTLSSDAFLGRMPFTEGETKTVNYLVDRLKAFGLEPGNGDSYIQEVPLVDIHGDPDENVHLSAGSESAEWELGEDFVVYSEWEQEEVSLEDSEFIFCGYGVVAPEYDWNDFEGIDVVGKTIVVLVNDPGLYKGDSTFFKAETMTYYGRWTYKYEEAARQGAAGVMIVHDTEMAGYPWTVVSHSWTGSAQNLQRENKGMDRSKIQGWMTTGAARQLFDMAGQDFDELKSQAAEPGFQAVPLGVEWSVSLRNRLTYNQSQNVVARIPGSNAIGENVIFTAHWDHFGIATPVDGDSIYNGAIDNATGVAALMEMGRTYVASGFQPDRSLVFLFVTAEEHGLLGSAYYAAHPIYPPATTVANLNMDALYAMGTMKDITMIGHGHSTFDEILEQEAATQHRTVTPDPEPEKGYFFRSDHFNFAKIGIPALYAKGGTEAREGGKQVVIQHKNQYNTQFYHQPSDEYHDDMNFEGIMEDVQLYYNLGWKLAIGEYTPKWKDGSEFGRQAD